MPKPAATLILSLQDSAICKDLLVFMLKRSHKSGFFANAHVFPGGALEDSDQILAQKLPVHLQQNAYTRLPGCTDAITALAFFIAAIRETAEESGYWLVISKDGASPSDELAKRLSSEQFEGKLFNQILEDNNLIPYIQRINPFSWWITPKAEKKRYDTRFFWAKAPLSQSPRINQEESSSGGWFTPKQMIHLFYEGQALLAPPTLATLEELQKPDFSFPASCLSFPICPEAQMENDQLLLVLPGDPLYSQSSTPVFSHRSRFTMNPEGRFF